MIRPAKPLALLAAALAMGCIENPGVDPELRNLKPETVTLQATYRQGKLLTFKLRRDSGRVFLDVSNSGLSAIDSATFLIRIMPPNGGYFSKVTHLDGLPDLEYYGRAESMNPGQGKSHGEIGTLEDTGFEGREAQAFLISLHQGGARKSNAFAGVYHGTHTRFDSAGRAFDGLVQGTVNADGAYLLGLYAAGSSSPIGVLDGAVREDGTFPDWFYLRNGNVSGRTGRLEPEPRGFKGSFILDARPGGWAGYYDSIQVRCEPYTPR